MSVHDLKTHPEPFEALWKGDKRAEVRSTADRTFTAGDLLTLREWDPATSRYTGYSVSALVTHIQPGGTFGLPKDLAVLSIRLIEHVHPSGGVRRAN